MEKFIGLKQIHAEPCSKRDYYKEKKGWFLRAEDDVEGYKVVYEDGYVSWSPRTVFEKAYRKIDEMTFSEALESCKRGKKIARRGWNNKGMFIFYLPESMVKEEWCKDTILKDLAHQNGGEIKCESMLRIHTASKTISSGWRPTNLDLFETDWYIV